MSWKRIPELITCVATCCSPLSTIAAYIGLTTWVYPVQVRLRNGASISVQSWDDLTTVWAVWFGNEYKIRATDRVFLDLGANIGAFASFVCASRNSKVFAVEPFPGNALRFSENLTSQMAAGACTLIERAIDWKEGTLYMPSCSSIPSHSRTVITEPSIEAVEVACVTIPTLVGLAGGSVDLLKVDIEGYEYALFDNIAPGDLRGIHRIVLEYHGADGHIRLTDLLGAHGFEISHHKPQGTRGIAEFTRCA